MRHPRIAHLGLVLLFLTTGCMDRDHPTAPVHPGDALHAISDAAHNGTQGFYFLPPMKSPAYSGTFDAALEPVVEVCAPGGCGTLHASFSMSEGVGSERVRLDGEHYMVNWHAGATDAVAGQTYRVRVRMHEVVLGYADVSVVSTGREAVSIRADGSVALVANQTLPVRFRIETGIVGAVVVSPAEATINVGETQQFSAALYDLHGEPLVGPTGTWSSGDTDVATMDADGLATGVGEGSATITASAGPASGSAALTVAGNVVASAWQAMGTGMNDPILGLTLYDGDLIAGGIFITAGGQTARAVARWNGSAWQAVGTGMNNSVFSLTVHEGDLIAGGAFTTAGGETANRVARWDGSAWHPMGGGMGSRVRALTVYEGDLIAGGTFTTADGQSANRVARWDGSAWQAMGTGMNWFVWALTVYDGDLIAGGQFTTADGQPANRVARWDGSAWQAMGTGMNSLVTSLAVYEGDLIAGGYFTTADGQTANRVARWDGSAWHPVGAGMDGGEGRALTVYEGDLIAGGYFTTADGQTANRVARWGAP